jgi:predicted Zn-dependent protease
MSDNNSDNLSDNKSDIEPDIPQSLPIVVRRFSRALAISTQALQTEIGAVAERGSVALAGQALCALIAVHPRNDDLVRTSVEFLFSQEQWPRAATLARWAAIADPSAPNADMIAAAYLFRVRDYATALIHAERGHRAAPTDAGPFFLTGRILMAMGQVVPGRRAIAKAAEMNAEYKFAAAVQNLSLTKQDFQRVMRRLEK